MSLETLQDAFQNELAVLLNAEELLSEVLPGMVKAVSDGKLKHELDSHYIQTLGHVERLKQAFESLALEPVSKKCVAMVGLVTECAEVIEETHDAKTLDALLIASAQKMEHYEIASYGTMCTWAECLGHPQAKKLLEQNLEEEWAANEKLSELALSVINEKSTKG